MRYTIRHISAWSAFKFGGVIGGLLGVFPGFTMGLAIRSLVRTLRVWLESWLSLDIPVLGSISLLDAVRLNDLLSRLQLWDGRGWLLVLLLTLLALVGGGLTTGLLSGLAAVVYNLAAAVSGGVVVRAEALDGAGALAGAPAPPPPTPAYPAARDSYPPALPQEPPIPASPGMAPISRDGPAGWLIAQSTQRRWPIGHGETRIGSGSHNHIVLDGLAVNHAAIRWEGSRFVLHDFSGGQTWVNGRSLVGPNMIKAGFQIRLANQEFLFQ
jgi:hypothetical protein